MSARISLVTSLLAVVVSFSFALNVIAATPQAGLVTAEVNVSDVVVISQDPEKLLIAFSMENRSEMPQADIRYGVELLRISDDEIQSLVDVYVPKEVVTLAPGQRVEQTLAYPLTGIAPGEYEAWVVARTTGGINLGQVPVGVVTVTGEKPVVEILPETCAVSIAGDGRTFTIGQGVDLLPSEQMTLVCTVKNHGKVARSVVPLFDTYRRSVYGEGAIDSRRGEVLEIGAGERATVRYQLPLPGVPQAYDTTVVYSDPSDPDQTISNRLVVHYVVRGPSATIQTLTLDRPSYTAGETMIINLNWSESADGFIGARLGRGSALPGDVVADVIVRDSQSRLCLPEATQRLTAEMRTLSVVSETDCLNPTVQVRVRTGSGQLLDERTTTPVPTVNEAEIPSATPPTPESAPIEVPTPPIALILIGLASIVVLVGTLVYLRRPKSPTILPILVVSLLSIGLWLGGAPTTQAVSWQHTADIQWNENDISYDWPIFNFTVNTNKYEYQPGESIILSASAQNLQCANTAFSYNLWADLEGRRVEVDRFSRLIGGGAIRYHTATINAPLNPGVYQITLTSELTEGYAGDDGDPTWRIPDIQSSPFTATIEIRVVAPPPPQTLSAPTGLRALPGACSSGQVTVSWNAVSGASNYTLRESGATIFTGPGLTFTQSGLRANQSLQYSVSATNGAGVTSPFSSTVMMTAPAECVVVPANNPPIANAGGNRVITQPESTVTIAGAVASDPDGNPITITWTNTGRPGGAAAPTISNGSTLTPTFSGLTTVGVYTFLMTVRDQAGLETTSSMTVTVLPNTTPTNGAPTANAGNSVTIIQPDNDHTVSGATASDPDGDPITTTWTNTGRPGGAGTPTITGATTLTPTFSGLTTIGIYQFTLTVRDNQGNETASTMTVTVEGAAASPNQPPAVNAGGGVTITLPTNTHTETGASATDPDGDPLTLTWIGMTRPTGAPSPSIVGGTTLTPTFSGLTYPGTYTFVLRAVDPSGASAEAMKTITVLANPPRISASPRVVTTANSNTTVTWDTNGYPVELCTLTGGGLTNADLIASGGVGSRSVTITALTTFRINCGTGASAQTTVELRPSQFET
jgi:hypothetical protein